MSKYKFKCNIHPSEDETDCPYCGDMADKYRQEQEKAAIVSDIEPYVKRLNPILDLETGTMIDEIDRMQLEIDMLKIDKKKFSVELHDLKWAIREALVIIEGNKCDLSEGAGAHEVLHNAGVQRDMDIIIKCCGDFL